MRVSTKNPNGDQDYPIKTELTHILSLYIISQKSHSSQTNGS